MFIGGFSSIKERYGVLGYLIGSREEEGRWGGFGDGVELWIFRVGLVKEKRVFRMLEINIAKDGVSWGRISFRF